MLKTFNNGIGIILVANKKDEKNIINEIKKQGFKSYKIGETTVETQQCCVSYKGDF